MKTRNKNSKFSEPSALQDLVDNVIENGEREKRIWNGEFSESKYTKTGNIVHDVIANGGRLVHEPTLDGYTHEIVDRGSYISDDYYFQRPSRDKKSKPYIHYELRSNGTVLIDGKIVTVNIEGGKTNMLPESWNNRSLDSTILQKESSDKIYEGKKLHELGLKFEADKIKLETEIMKVQNSKISANDKRKLIVALEKTVTLLQEQYEQDVTEEEQKVQKELNSHIDSMQEAADELELQSESLRNVEMEAAATDTLAAADEADAQKQVFENMKSDYLEKLQLQMEQAENQKRNILSKCLRGR